MSKETLMQSRGNNASFSGKTATFWLELIGCQADRVAAAGNWYGL